MSNLTEPPIATEAKPRMIRSDRPLQILCVESTRARWSWLFIAGIVVALYALMILHFWAPADGGVDQNAYLLGGRMIAEHFTPRYTLPNPFAYVGNMFIRTSPLATRGGDYYPKYPFGLPLLYASFFWIAGPTKAASQAFLVSPVCSILAIAGMFFLARVIVGSFAAVMAAILLGTSQLTMTLANNPNSHSTCMAFVVWGMYVLIKWWQRGEIWLGLLAGFLIGYAALVRYSEGLLVLPIAVACASRLRWTDWRSYLRSAVPGLAWAVPVGTLLIFNKVTMGNWTGYDSTNESEGFTWVKFTQTWEQMIRTYYDLGAFFVLPFGIAGLMLIFRRSWQLGIMLLAWLLPGTALYTSYYWSPDRGISYARFILTFLPAVMLGAAICFQDGMLASALNARWYQRLPSMVSVMVIVAIAGGLGRYRAMHGLQNGQGGGLVPLPEEHRVRQNLANIGQVLLKHVPTDAVLFADDGTAGGQNERPLNYIQFLRHWDVYSSDAFDAGGPRRAAAPRRNLFGLGGANPDPNLDPNAAPTTRQPLQLDYIASLYQGKSSTDLRKEQGKVIDTALKAGHGVFALAQVPNDHDIRRTFNLAGKYKITAVETWTDLPPGPPDPVLENNSNGGRKNRGGGGGAGGGGRRANGGGAATVEATATSWELLEIKPQPGA